MGTRWESVPQLQAGPPVTVQQEEKLHLREFSPGSQNRSRRLRAAPSRARDRPPHRELRAVRLSLKAGGDCSKPRPGKGHSSLVGHREHWVARRSRAGRLRLRPHPAAGASTAELSSLDLTLQSRGNTRCRSGVEGLGGGQRGSRRRVRTIARCLQLPQGGEERRAASQRETSQSRSVAQHLPSQLTAEQPGRSGQFPLWDSPGWKGFARVGKGGGEIAPRVRGLRGVRCT